MNRTLLSTAFVLLSISCVDNVQAVDCTPADIQISSQSDVDNFQSNHGPGCDTVTGDLIIGSVAPADGGSDIGHLNGLSKLNFIQGGLLVQRNPNLTDVNGLAGLESVGGDFEIRDNETLSDCRSFSAILDFIDDGVEGPALSATPDVGGEIHLGGNAEGCNSAEEIAPPPSRPFAMTGSWYSPNAPGVGFMWHAVHDELAVAYYYGFTDKEDFTEEGDRFWLVGVHEGPIEWGEDVTFEFSYVTGGNFQNFRAADITEHHWGTMELTSWYDCKESSFNITGQFPGDDTPRSYISGVVRLAPVAGYECFRTNYPTHATDGLTGSWFDSDTPGQGFSVHKVDDDTGIIYYYGFDNRGESLWLIGVWDGAVSFGEVMTVQMNEVSGGGFLFFTEDQIVQSEWGILRIRFDHCTAGWAELVGADGFQEFELSLLAGSAGLECEN